MRKLTGDPLALNRTARANFRLNNKFEGFLSELGTPLYHPVKGYLTLLDIFVYPDLSVRGAGAKLKAELREIRSEDVFVYTSKARRVVFQAPSLGGKTSLAKMLFWDLFRTQAGIPLLLNGREVSSADEGKILGEIWKAFSFEYTSEMLEEFRQLPKTERILVVDDWDRTTLNPEGRKAVLSMVSQYLDRIFLFTDEIFQIHELLDKSADMVLEFEQATLEEFGHTLRGKLIDKWVTIGREYTGDRQKITREIEEKERLIQNMIGKNTLPSLPFVVLCLLQADEENKAEVAEAGSFGYLYEVLVTTSLSKSMGLKPQLEKKYIFLVILAYRMFKQQTRSLPLTRVREIAKEYSDSHLVNVDFDAMISDLEEAHLLVNIAGDYAFAYSHLLYYFIARYYRDNLDRESGLRAEIEQMVDHISSDEYSSVPMFTVYCARHSTEIVEKLVTNANRIYLQENVADLDSDVAFLNRLSDKPDIDIPNEDVDIAKVRQERRAFQDKIRKETKPDRSDQQVVYSEDLSDTDKFKLAHRHITLLGQVIRNFPASLPGPDKLKILKATYLLGLRVLHVLLRRLQGNFERFRTDLAAVLEGGQEKKSPKTKYGNSLALCFHF